MQTSYIHAAIYSLLAVAIVLMLDFRSVRVSLLAMMPMACGVVQMFGLLGWLEIPLNPANLIVLPLILGIGIDDGVHVMHDYLRTTGRYRVGNSTATAIVLTTATTMVGFGSMMIAHHQGLRSLGQVLTLGMGCCLLTSLLSLPAVLAVMSAHRVSATQEPVRREPPAPHFSPRRSGRPAQHASSSVALQSPRRADPDPRT
jgi:predicted RND superfamily exporter protein